MTTINSAFKRVSQERILEFERRHNLTLEEDYRAFLKKFNGGVPQPNTFRVPALGESILLDILFGIDLQKDFNVESWLEEYKDDMPSGFVIIGADSGGNLLLLADSQVQKGIFYWDHTFSFKQSSKQRNTYYLAPSFSQFIADLM